MKRLLAAMLTLTTTQTVPAQNLTSQLEKLDSRAVPAEQARSLDQMLAKHVRARIHAAHLELADEWTRVRSLDDWRKFRDPRIAALRRSLAITAPAGEMKVRIAGGIDGDGYRVDRLVIEGRAGLPITANLYLPAKLPKAMPAIIVLHSFFHGKHQGELQDLGVNGARAGCAVLVPDLLGHGERRQHPFVDAASYPEKFNVPRQDYFMRSVLGLQLDAVGESLMGWYVADTMRCVSVMLARPDIDREKIIVLGAVAAGGDIAGVAGALDPRITCVVPYNFGGPEPETPYPLPLEGELSFPYSSGGHWDSTRRLRNSARDGFLPWVVVGATAPRSLIHAHEFAWDREGDAAWKRLTRIYELHGKPQNLGVAFGKGTLFGKPEGTGCGNIGAFHRRTLAPFLKDRLGIAWPEKEIEHRRAETQLRCLTPALREEFKLRPLHDVVGELATARLAEARKKHAALPPAQQKTKLQAGLETLLGNLRPGEPKVRHHASKSLADPKTRPGSKKAGPTVERTVLVVEPGMVVPLLLLRPPAKVQRPAVVIMVGQQGKQEILSQLSSEISQLLEAGVAVCLPDVRGTGETCPTGDRRGRPAGSLVEMRRTSEGVLLASEVQMLGQTLLGERLRDLRSVLRYLRGRSDLDGRRLALWGFSFVEVNRQERLVVPLDAVKYPAQAEPLGGLLALLGALYEEDVRAVHMSGGLLSYQSLLRSAWVHVPADAVVSGILTVGDLRDVAAMIGPHLRVGSCVDAVNRHVSEDDLKREGFAIGADKNASRWLIETLGKR